MRRIEYAAKPTGIVPLFRPLEQGLPCKQPLTIPIIQSSLIPKRKFLTFIPARFQPEKSQGISQTEIIA